MNPSIPRRVRWFVFACACAFASGCGKDGAPNVRHQIREQQAPRVQAIALEILTRHTAGLRQAADRIGAGFVKVSGVQQETDMRQVLKLIRNVKRGVPELVISPMSFLAAV
ncbi:MAG TPA: hypothetical protein VHZ95_14605, partial [Polyangiales bacterium]|nr:hypothetical protein [Polyangiales bacterium]